MTLSSENGMSLAMSPYEKRLQFIYVRLVERSFSCQLQHNSAITCQPCSCMTQMHQHA